MATNNSLNTATTSGTVIAGNGTVLTNLAYSSSGGTSNIVSRDSNGNSHGNNFESATNGNTAAGTITLTAASARNQVFSSGSGSAIVILPDATTLINGHVFELNNNASGNLTIEANGGGTLFSMLPGSYAEVILLSNAFAAGQWDHHWALPSNSAYGTAGLTISGYLASAPPSSATATTAWVTSLTAGTAQQNTSGYDILVTVCVTVTAATTATLVMGVGSTSTPTKQTVVPSFTVASSTQYTWNAYVPNNYYLLVDTTGTITISSITTMAMGI